MEYSFLQNFSSLLEVYTAIYVSMFIDDILVNIWTPDYKQKISQLIKGMNIPAISFFVKKVEDNIDDNAKEIRGHMKRKAVFLLSVCMSFLLLAGLENKSVVLPSHGYMIAIILSLVGLVMVLLGRWTFIKYPRVVLCIALYGFIFVTLYFTGIADYISAFIVPTIDEYKIAVISVLLLLTLPIIWQMFLIWVYSSLYKGYMHEKLSREAYIYGKAYIAYKIKDMAALPKEYEMVAKDFVSAQATEGDTSLNSLNSILVARLEKLCELPNVIKVFISWVHFNLRGRHNREAEYLEKHGFDYESMITPDVGEEEPKAENGINEAPINEENEVLNEK